MHAMQLKDLMEENKKKMHIAMVPWLAMGHIIPFHHLAISLAQRGHMISFLSTPMNLRRLPPASPTLAHLITYVPIPFIRRPPSLHPQAESTADFSYSKHQLLKAALDSLEPAVTTFLYSSSPRPDWVVFDFPSYWVPGIAQGLGIRAVYFGLFTAAFFSFLGPPSAFLNEGSPSAKLSVESLTAVPEWVHESGFAFRPYEIAKFVQRTDNYKEVTPDTVRLGVTLRDCDFMPIRTCPEFEPEWFKLYSKLFQKPLVPVGFLPPHIRLAEEPKDEEVWASMQDWLDQKASSSVVYVALGSEVELSEEEVQNLALGLEKTGLPFLWVIRDPPESAQRAEDMLPNGFKERVEGRGMVSTGWAPQVRILSHRAVGGFLTHCGCNSFIEGLAFGRVLILLPMINDQGLNARLLQRKNLGIEVERNEKDGSYTPDSIAKAVTTAMVAETGKLLRDSAQEAMTLFGNKEKNDHCIDEFVLYMEERA